MELLLCNEQEVDPRAPLYDSAGEEKLRLSEQDFYRRIHIHQSRQKRESAKSGLSYCTHTWVMTITFG